MNSLQINKIENGFIVQVAGEKSSSGSGLVEPKTIYCANMSEIIECVTTQICPGGASARSIKILPK